MHVAPFVVDIWLLGKSGCWIRQPVSVLEFALLYAVGVAIRLVCIGISTTYFGDGLGEDSYHESVEKSKYKGYYVHPLHLT